MSFIHKLKGIHVGMLLVMNMSSLEILQQITSDLAKYYPDLEQLGTTIAPLKEMVTTVNIARESKAKIEEMRATLLK